MTTLPKIQRERLRMTKDVVPQGLRCLDYWQIMDYWKMFDKNGDGNLDKNEFYCLVNRMNNEPVDRMQSDQMFSCVDADKSGEIDCEEFLSWIFQMYAPYSGGLRDRLGDMDPQQVIQCFQRIDANGSGSLDKTEFARFVSKFLPEAKLSQKEQSDLFDTIDKDGSGEVDANEFVRWAYPGLGDSEDGIRRGGRAPPSRPGSKERGRGSPKPGSPKSRNELGSSAGFMPSPGAQPIVLEFTIGPDFKVTMLQIQKAFSKRLADSVSTKIIIDPYCSGCSRFVLRIGRGVVLWDKPTMMAYRDNPFETFDTSRQFVLDVVKERMPTLLRAGRVR